MSKLVSFFLIFLFFGFLNAQSQNFDELKLIFVKTLNTENFEYVELNETSELLNHPDYDNDRPTMLYGYGYTEKYTELSTQTVVGSFIERGQHNILVVEWSNYSSGQYIQNAVMNSYSVGEILGKILLRMKKEGFNLKKFHLVGHSLGGQLVGFIGRSVIKNSNNNEQITRITALDPSSPAFYGFWSSVNKPLNKNDGLFVDVIHTDYDFYGAPVATGDADFWPNEGKEQPGCPLSTWDVDNDDSFCSHQRSWYYFSESVRSVNEKTFNSVKCASWENFKNGSCEESDGELALFMGFDADPRMSGDYYLQTNADEPFNKGEYGTTYEDFNDAT